MCSRYELNATAAQVMARFRLRMPPPLPNRAEVRPTDQALVVLPDGAARLARWGLERAGDKRPLINARAETLATRFRRILEARVLVPASAWWEWDAGKTKYRLSLPGLFAFAGLLDGDRFVMVTTGPLPAIAHVHDRMPAVVADEDGWLSGGELKTSPGPVAVEADSPQGSLF